jgi:putative addiction module component (TIGR02574 family)
MMNAEQLITEACSLPLEQRAQVVERLLQSLSASNAEIDRAWLSLAQRRHDELSSGKVAGIPGNEVFARIARRFGG